MDHDFESRRENAEPSGGESSSHDEYRSEPHTGTEENGGTTYSGTYHYGYQNQSQGHYNSRQDTGAQNQYGADGWYPPPPQPQNPGSGLAVASMVLGIVSLCTCLTFCLGYGAILAPAMAILAIVFALISRTSAGKMSGMAIAGLILGITSLVLCLILFAFGILFLGILSEVTESYYHTYYHTYYDPYYDGVYDDNSYNYNDDWSAALPRMSRMKG